MKIVVAGYQFFCPREVFEISGEYPRNTLCLAISETVPASATLSLPDVMGSTWTIISRVTDRKYEAEVRTIFVRFDLLGEPGDVGSGLGWAEEEAGVGLV